jgi:hypothetical protein
MVQKDKVTYFSNEMDLLCVDGEDLRILSVLGMLLAHDVEVEGQLCAHSIGFRDVDVWCISDHMDDTDARLSFVESSLCHFSEYQRDVVQGRSSDRQALIGDIDAWVVQARNDRVEQVV